MEGVPRDRPDRGRLQLHRREVAGGGGKLVGLVALLDEHSDAIEADLLRYYRVDLLDFYRGELSARRLRVLLRHLPPDAALVRALNGGIPGWSVTDHLIADLWALTLKAHGDGRRRTEDHPVRVQMEAAARAAARRARVEQMSAEYARRKRVYGYK